MDRKNDQTSDYCLFMYVFPSCSMNGSICVTLWPIQKNAAWVTLSSVGLLPSCLFLIASSGRKRRKRIKIFVTGHLLQSYLQNNATYLSILLCYFQWLSWLLEVTYLPWLSKNGWDCISCSLAVVLGFVSLCMSKEHLAPDLWSQTRLCSQFLATWHRSWPLWWPEVELEPPEGSYDLNYQILSWPTNEWWYRKSLQTLTSQFMLVLVILLFQSL